MNFAIIGSSQYLDKFKALKEHLEHCGEVRIPAFDDHPEFNELQLCEYNRSIIEWADSVYVIWDGRSVGTVFDFGMAFALRKPIVIEYIEAKTIANVMRMYEQSTQ